MSDRDLRDLLADPEPWLDKLTAHSSELLVVLREVEYAPSPDTVFDAAKAMGIAPQRYRLRSDIGGKPRE